MGICMMQIRHYRVCASSDAPLRAHDTRCVASVIMNAPHTHICKHGGHRLSGALAAPSCTGAPPWLVGIEYAYLHIHAYSSTCGMLQSLWYTMPVTMQHIYGAYMAHTTLALAHFGGAWVYFVSTNRQTVSIPWALSECRETDTGGIWIPYHT